MEMIIPLFEKLQQLYSFQEEKVIKKINSKL